jgi:hypothetical protein
MQQPQQIPEAQQIQQPQQMQQVQQPEKILPTQSMQQTFVYPVSIQEKYEMITDYLQQLEKELHDVLQLIEFYEQNQ